MAAVSDALNAGADAAALPADRLVKLIATFEGFVPTMYKDPAGNDTIGYGHLIVDNEGYLRGKTLTREEALDLLRKDIANRTSLGSVSVSLEERQRDALTSLCFNIGAARFAGSDVVKRVNAGELDGAREFFAHWRRAGGRVSRGLCMRRLAEVCIFSHAPVDPESSDPPSVQWGVAAMKITDENWHILSAGLRRRAIIIYEEYWNGQPL